MKANLLAMVRARAEIDEHLNRVLVLSAPAPGDLDYGADAAAELIRAHIASARRVLAGFERAARGE